MNQVIPLSYNPIDSVLLGNVLSDYEWRSHTEIVTDFEKEIAMLTGSRYVVALQSGTAALHMALKALQVTAQDEVLTSTFTYVGSVNPILYQQAVPVFIDSELITWNMDPDLLEKAILNRAKKPKAILVVHSYGMPANMDSLLAISTKYGIPILEDAAEGIGSTYQGKHLGTMGDIGVLSFNNNKVVTTYGGGALLTNNELVYKQVLYWAGQARENKPYYEHKEVGYNYRMGSLNAAAGLTSLKDFKSRIASSRHKFECYKLSLQDVFQFEQEPPGYFSNRWLSTLLVVKNDISIIKLLEDLKAVGIESRPFWNPMHKQPVFSHYNAYLNGNSEFLFRQGLCLPSSFTLSEKDQNRVVESIRKLMLK